MSEASDVTFDMRDAFITGSLNEADTTTFKDYATYKLALNKIDTQPGPPKTIEWSSTPNE
ncbi:hypothetical protein [Pseudomonas sp. 10S4]|uniref:hypothetical protein n=1 Tax=Pseudomonas sp. 10S4 TaxID=3048583 RepID=UPI002AC9136C|nr:MULTISPECIES: hypothetical protein [unclassified Pseudomonas]MEB0223796.1 hypothetical protein [Pseudomonas sp. 5S1]MEB0292826.1 hypothetical protein [Pseudomonas sp. 10S4]WPX16265.1 hypothetical protein RHM58_19655 [Pseudomonas sp. 10S4]